MSVKINVLKFSPRTQMHAPKVGERIRLLTTFEAGLNDWLTHTNGSGARNAMRDAIGGTWLPETGKAALRRSRKALMRERGVRKSPMGHTEDSLSFSSETLPTRSVASSNL